MFNVIPRHATATTFRALMLAAVWSSALGCGEGAAPASPEPAKAEAQAVAAPAPAADKEEPKPPPPAAKPPVPAAAAGQEDPLFNPRLATATAPERYTVKLDTTKGDILIDVERAWAPIGADRFYHLVKIGYFSDNAFFRVVKGFMAQVGLHGQPEVNRVWRRASIKDDPVTQKNERGMVTFATSGKDSRVNQFYINLADNLRLDAMGFAPFGKVRDMAPVDRLHSGYGEGAPAGRGPRQALIQSTGNAYLMAEFPELDYIVTATFVEP